MHGWRGGGIDELRRRCGRRRGGKDEVKKSKGKTKRERESREMRCWPEEAGLLEAVWLAGDPEVRAVPTDYRHDVRILFAVFWIPQMQAPVLHLSLIQLHGESLAPCALSS